MVSLDDAVHDVDLQGVQVWQDFVALWTGVFRNIPLMGPVTPWNTERCMTILKLNQYFLPDCVI